MKHLVSADGVGGASNSHLRLRKRPIPPHIVKKNRPIMKRVASIVNDLYYSLSDNRLECQKCEEYSQ